MNSGAVGGCTACLVGRVGAERGRAGALKQVVAEQDAARCLDELVERQVGERLGVEAGEPRNGIQGGAGRVAVAADLARLPVGWVARERAPPARALTDLRGEAM